MLSLCSPRRCAIIKRQLRLLLPGIRVFLDVDDLTDISSLETYIESSASIVVFLSKVHRARVRARRLRFGLGLLYSSRVS